MAQAQRTLTKDDVREAALVVLRGLVEGIEDGRIEAIRVNVDNVPLEYPGDGLMVTGLPTTSTVTFTTVPKD